MLAAYVDLGLIGEICAVDQVPPQRPHPHPEPAEVCVRPVLLRQKNLIQGLSYRAHIGYFLLIHFDTK